MKRLADDEVEIQLKKIPAWQRKGNEIQRSYQFGSFMDSIAFVNKLAAEAEKADHHPDILVKYNKVELHLSTHDANGLTERDFKLAAICERLAQS